MRDFSNERLTLEFVIGDEWVFATPDNAWIAATDKTVEVTAEEHEAVARMMVKRWNAVMDALAVMERSCDDHGDCPFPYEAMDILSAAMEP